MKNISKKNHCVREKRGRDRVCGRNGEEKCWHKNGKSFNIRRRKRERETSKGKGAKIPKNDLVGQE
jgi:hypothetical protein